MVLQDRRRERVNETRVETSSISLDTSSAPRRRRNRMRPGRTRGRPNRPRVRTLPPLASSQHAHVRVLDSVDALPDGDGADPKPPQHARLLEHRDGRRAEGIAIEDRHDRDQAQLGHCSHRPRHVRIVGPVEHEVIGVVAQPVSALQQLRRCTRCLHDQAAGARPLRKLRRPVRRPSAQRMTIDERNRAESAALGR